MTSVRSSLDLGSAVRIARNDLGLTQDVLSAAAGVGPRFVVELERGKATVRMDKVLATLEVLGLELQVAPRPSSLKSRA